MAQSSDPQSSESRGTPGGRLATVIADLVGHSPAIEVVRGQIRQILRARAQGRRMPAVLIEGETGTGKGLVARILHRAGPRADGPFIDINCAAIPESLLESELFGFERGAFTDARRPKPGLFHTAHRGTIFLDEVGLLPHGLQAKLLTVLEEGTVRRLGATRTEPVDVWVLSATNTDIPGAIRDLKFREDLYHRLAVLTLKLPPLRERGRDVVFLAERFLARICQDYGLQPKSFTPDAVAALLAYRWPGNIRELANVMERAALLMDGDVVRSDALALGGSSGTGPAIQPETRPRPMSAEEAACEHLRLILDRTGWNVSRAAAVLGVARNTVRARIERCRLRRGETAQSSTEPMEASSVDLVAVDPVVALTEMPATSTKAPVQSTPTTAPPTIRWERRTVTFIRVSLTRDEAHGPGVDEVLQLIVEKIKLFGGRVEEIAYASLDASFGLEALEERARRAGNAALVIAKAIGGSGEMSCAARLAIHSPSVLVGYVADTPEVDREDKRVISSMLDDLIAAAEPGAVLLSPEASDLLDRHFSLSMPGAETSSRLAARVLGYPRNDLALRRRLSRLVGRGRELDVLATQWGATLRGSGQIVALVGEAGVGKSRLCWEFTERYRTGALVLESAAAVETASIPYGHVVEVLRRLFAVALTDDAEAAREKCVRHLEDLDPTLMPLLSSLLALLNVPLEDEPWQRLDAARRRQRMREAVNSVLIRESRRRPVMLIVEDVQWLDSESQAVLEAVADGLPTARVFLLVTYRPEYPQRWGGRSYYTQLRVDPLHRKETAELAVSLLGDDPSISSVRERVVEVTEGNPLFVEETIRSLVQSEALVPEDNRYRLRRSVDLLEVPSSIEEVIAGRIDCLTPQGRDLICSAAVIGRDVPQSVLAAVAGLSEEHLDEALAPLREHEFLYDKGSYPQREYIFKHALTQAVAYRGIPESRRRVLHERSLQAIENRFPTQADEHIVALGHHAFQAQRWRKAVTYLWQAGARAFDRFANREAVLFFDQAVSALERLPETSETLAQAIDLRLALRNALTPLGDSARVLQALREARVYAERLGDSRRLARALAFETNALYLVADFQSALESGRRAHRLAIQSGDFALEIAIGMYLGRTHSALGRFGEARDILSKIVAGLSGERAQYRCDLPVLPAVFARCLLVAVVVEQGHFAEAARHAGDALALARSLDHPDTLFWACYTVGTVALARGDLMEAISPFKEALTVCRRYNISAYALAAESAVAWADALDGRAVDAVPRLQTAVTEAKDRQHNSSLALYLIRLGEACALASMHTEAYAAAEEALELARRQGARGTEAHALWLTASLSPRPTVPDDVPDAERRYSQALAIAEELGMRPLGARCHLGLGSVFVTQGDRSRGQAHLRLAAQSLREMGLSSLLRKAEDALAKLA